MYSDYFTQMLQFRDYTAPLAENLGLPTVRSLIIRRRENKNISYTSIQPLPVITIAYPQAQGLSGINSLEITTGDFEVKGVSRTYTRSQLVGSRIDYIIDGVLSNEQGTGGIICDLIAITENILTWDLSLRQKIGEQKLY